MPDYFKVPDPLHLTHEMEQQVPSQPGVWWLEPAYRNAMHFFLHTGTGKCFTRMRLPVEFNAAENQTLGYICKHFPGDNWLHCIRFFGQDPDNPKSYAFAVSDYLDFTETYESRRATLEKVFQPLGIRLLIQDKFYFLVPRYSTACAPNLWAGMQMMNRDWKRRVFTGIIARKGDSLYPNQTEAYTRTTPYMHYHPFAHAISSL